MTDVKYLEAVETQYAAVRECKNSLKPHLAVADAYYWENGPASACWEAAQSLPTKWKPAQNVLGPSIHGAWWYFRNMNGIFAGPIGVHIYRNNLVKPPSFILSVFVKAEYNWDFAWPDDVRLADVFAWNLQRFPDRYGDEPDAHERRVQFISRFFGAASIWLAQRILVPRYGHIERHRRKQLMRETRSEHVPTVKVIELRRELQIKKERPLIHSVVNFQVRWIVKGHFREQYCPSTGTHKTMFIEDHIKGPADKPLKVPTHTIYAATR